MTNFTQDIEVNLEKDSFEHPLHIKIALTIITIFIIISTFVIGRPGHQHWLEISWQRVKGGDAWEKQNLCHRLYQKVGNYFPVVKNQNWSFFP